MHLYRHNARLHLSSPVERRDHPGIAGSLLETTRAAYLPRRKYTGDPTAIDDPIYSLRETHQLALKLVAITPASPESPTSISHPIHCYRLSPLKGHACNIKL